MSAGERPMSLDDARALEREHVVPAYARLPVHFVSGDGAILWDDEGNEYLDFQTGLAVTALGHGHPTVVRAIAEQAERLVHVGNFFYSEPALRLAQRLSQCSLGGKVHFANSGTEANEAAIKIARKARQGGEIVSLRRAFHGRTYGSLSATPQESKQAPFAPLVPGFVAVEPTARAVAGAVDERTAAVLLEPVQGESGIHALPDEVLHAAREACDRAGALLIFDEVQCGMGRTGTMWAYEQSGVRPDVMTLAKGLGGGLPIGACVTNAATADVLAAGDHGSTFAGGPVVAAGAHAVLDVVDDAELLEGVERPVDGRQVDLGVDGPHGGGEVVGGGVAVVLGGGAAGTEPGPQPAERLDLLSYGASAPLPFAADDADRRFEYRIGRRPGFLDGRPGFWWTVNGRLFPDVPMYAVAEGEVVRMTISNGSGDPHPMHLHGHHAVVLSRNGVAATGSPWWVDSLDVQDGETYEIAFLADNPGVWMDHCHNLPHAAEGLVVHLMYEGVETPFRVGAAAGRATNAPE